MTQLAKRHDGRTVTRLEEIAQREGVSANFLVQILNDLRRAGLIESRRGKSGGYHLSRPPEEITLREMVDAVEPSLVTFSTQTGGESGLAVRQTWEQITQTFQQKLASITLRQIASSSEDPMFYI